MVPNIKEIGLKIISMVKENIPGPMVENIKDIGKTICFTALVFTLGQMAENMMVSTKMTKNMEKEFILGLMERDTMEAGKTANNMEKLLLQIPKDKAKLVFGKMEIESNGLVEQKAAHMANNKIPMTTYQMKINILQSNEKMDYF
jgi:hypothetical protein